MRRIKKNLGRNLFVVAFQITPRVDGSETRHSRATRRDNLLSFENASQEEEGRERRAEEGSPRRHRPRLPHDARHRRPRRRLRRRRESRGRVQGGQARVAQDVPRHPPRQGRLRRGVPRRAGGVRRSQGQEDVGHHRNLRLVLRAELQHQHRVQARQRCRREGALPARGVLRGDAREHQRPGVSRRAREDRQVLVLHRRPTAETGQRRRGEVQVRTRRALPPGGYRCIERRSHRRRRRGTRAEEEARPPHKAQTGRSQADREGVRRLGGQDPGQLCSRRVCRSRRRHLRPVVARRVLAGPGESPPRPSQPRARTGPRRVRTSAPRDERGGVLRI